MEKFKMPKDLLILCSCFAGFSAVMAAMAGDLGWAIVGFAVAVMDWWLAGLGD